MTDVIELERDVRPQRRSAAINGQIWGFKRGCVLGWAFNEARPDVPVRLTAKIAGQSYQCTAGYDPAYLGIEGPANSGFALPLHNIDHAKRVFVELLDQETGAVFCARELTVEPIVHAHGHASADILALQAKPLTKLQYFRFLGDTLTLFGFAQSEFGAGQGDRSDIVVDLPAGAIADVRACIPTSPGHDAVFWYLAGSEYSGLAVDVDLSTLQAGSEEIEIAVRYRGTRQDTVQRLANTTWWPSRLDAYGPYPGGGRLERVHSAEDRRSVALSGYTDARRIEEIYRHYAGDLSGKTVLDWGCGHGRVIRHLHRHRDVICHGADIDPDNIDWAQRHLPGIDFSTSPLMPPLAWKDESFDLIYGISVMTHLMPGIQRAWLAELRRVTRKGGLVMLTYAGDASVAYSSRYLPADWIDAYRRDGWNSEAYENFTGSVEQGYYRNVHQRMAAVKEMWDEYFDIAGIHEATFGYQGIAILRR